MMSGNKTGLEIDWDTADRITLLCLKESLETNREELRKHLEEGAWLHPEDKERLIFKIIPALEVIVDYYGG